MDVIKVGSLILDFQLLLFIIGSIAAYAAIRMKVKQMEVPASYAEPYIQVHLLGFGIWKFSPLLFDPLSVIAHPLSLLYFDGGFGGALLGGAIAILWLLFRTRRTHMIRDHFVLLGWGWLIFSTLTMSIRLFVEPDALVLLLGQLLCNFTLLLYILLRKRGPMASSHHHSLPNSRCWQWYSLAMIALGFIDPQRLQFVLGLSKSQLVFALLFAVSLLASFKSDHDTTSAGGTSHAK